MHRRLVPLLALVSCGLAAEPGVGRASPSDPAPAPLGAVVEEALGTDAERVMPALRTLAARGAADEPAAEVAVATLVAVLSRAHWTGAARGVDVRVDAIEALESLGRKARGVLGTLARVADEEGVDARIRAACRAARVAIDGGRAGPGGTAERRAAIAASIDHLRTMMLYFVGSGVGLEKPWPHYGGKRLVLWLVATNKLDRSDEKQLGLLFSPGDAVHSLEKAGGAKAYAALTRQALGDPTVDVGPLTSYAGRRNDEKEHVLSAAEVNADSPVLADLSFPGGAVLAFPSGNVRWVSAEDLGLPPDQPIVVGDASPVAILRHLSDR